MPWLWYILLLVVQFLGLFFTLLGLPGLWVMVAGVAGYAWLTGFNHFVGWPGLGTVIALAALAELCEFLAGSAGAKQAGGSRRAMVGGIVGAVIGGIVFSIPVPILGTIFGVCAGAFVGAAVMEMGVARDAAKAGRVGWGAAKGSFWGIVFKLVFGIAILITTAIVALPL